MKFWKSKFFYTQISAGVVGFTTIFAAMFILMRWIDGWNVAEIWWHGWLQGLGIAIPPFVALFSWGKVLVLLGVLTKEEAKGYPFSRPWEKTGDYLSDDWKGMDQ